MIVVLIKGTGSKGYVGSKEEQRYEHFHRVR